MITDSLLDILFENAPDVYSVYVDNLNGNDFDIGIFNMLTSLRDGDLEGRSIKCLSWEDCETLLNHQSKRMYKVHKLTELNQDFLTLLIKKYYGSHGGCFTYGEVFKIQLELMTDTERVFFDKFLHSTVFQRLEDWSKSHVQD